MILLRQAKKQEWNLFLRQKWGAGKRKEFLGKYFLWGKKKGNLKAIRHALFLIESPKQIVRNLGTIRVRLVPYCGKKPT